MMRVIMPPDDGTVKPSYRGAYYEATARWLRAGGAVVEERAAPSVWCGGAVNIFSCAVAAGTMKDPAQVVMDFSDFLPFQRDPAASAAPYIKWRYCPERADHRGAANVFPGLLVPRFDPEAFEAARRETCYRASGDLILNNQTPRAAAALRRRHVHEMLRARYGDKVSTDIMPQGRWWRLHGECFLAVAVPGARFGIFDKGLMEEMGLGVCILSPEITDVLPWGRRPQPWVHYVPVREDFADLVDRVEECRADRQRCVGIGAAARRLFDETVPPKAYCAWIEECVRGYYHA